MEREAAHPPTLGEPGLTLLALSIARPFPYGPVAVVVLFAALSPPFYRKYSQCNWRIPLWHVFPLFLLIAVACLLFTSYVRSVQEIGELYWLFDNGFYPGPNEPTQADLQKASFSSFRHSVIELTVLSFIPAAISFSISRFVTKRVCRK